MERVERVLGQLDIISCNGIEDVECISTASGLQNVFFGNNTESTRCLRWMKQKDQLKQDVFLVSEGGPLCRWLALHYCAVEDKTFQYLSLTRDTCESDLKQRREIVKGHSIFTDQAVLQAALNGDILILEGLEKAERNVLPVLNNLLENREMALEDGRFLLAPNRFNSLLNGPDKLTKEELESKGLIPVHENFRVIAIGLPVPPFTGNPLDPPLRSRFQSYSIPNVSIPVLRSIIKAFYISSDYAINSLETLLTFVYNLRDSTTEVANTSGVDNQLLAFHHLPHIGEPGILSASRTIELFPNISIQSIINRIYPWRYSVTNENAIKIIEKNLELISSNSNQNTYIFISAERTPKEFSDNVKISKLQFMNTNESFLTSNDLFVIFKQLQNGEQISIRIRAGPNPLQIPSTIPVNIRESSYHHIILSKMIQSHAAQRDICIIGNKGEGKSFVVAEFAKTLGYAAKGTGKFNQVSVEPLFLYKDMSARDLLQRRSTTSEGETIWKATPLVRAMRLGGLAILDGIHRLPLGSIGVLLRLIQDRELTLFDGTKFLRWDRYCNLRNNLKVSDEILHSKYSIYPIHPCFRIIATATPPSRSSPWLNNEMLHLFEFHTVDVFSPDEGNFNSNSVALLLQKIVPDSSWDLLVKLENLGIRMRTLANDPVVQLENPVSLRQLIRLSKKSVKSPEETYETLSNILMLPFLPLQRRHILEQLLIETGLSKSDFFPSSEDEERNMDKYEIKTVLLENGNTLLSIGNIDIIVTPPPNPELVPEVLFYNIPKHVTILRSMLKDFIQGEHLLLIGNQGVGKNKLTDKLLQLMQREREYIQLHRDTTVQSLTLSPSLEGGVIVWKDSPLVRAMKFGRVLVIDEADKAPTEVVCILKALLEDGEILLSDGRRFVSKRSRYHQEESQVESYISDFKIQEAFKSNFREDTQSICSVHDEFRVIALANRPGYPFLGNDFFGEMGDALAAYAIDNPDPQSEFQLLRSYGPNVDEEILWRLTAVFQDLRAMNEEGLLTYPYSTRELVNIIRHLENFPEDTLGNVLKNVFDFDRYDLELLKLLYPVFHRHGIPMLAPDELHIQSTSSKSKEEFPSSIDSGTNGDNLPVRLAKTFPLPPLKVIGRGFVIQDFSLSFHVPIPDTISIPTDLTLCSIKELNSLDYSWFSSRKEIWSEESYHSFLPNIKSIHSLSPITDGFISLNENPFRLTICLFDEISISNIKTKYISLELPEFEPYLNNISSVRTKTSLFIFSPKFCARFSLEEICKCKDDSSITSIRYERFIMDNINGEKVLHCIVLDPKSTLDSLILYQEGENKLFYLCSTINEQSELLLSSCELSYACSKIHTVYPHRLRIEDNNENIHDVYLFYNTSRMALSHSEFIPEKDGIPTHLYTKPVRIQYAKHRTKPLQLNRISPAIPSSRTQSLAGILRNIQKKQILQQDNIAQPLIADSVRNFKETTPVEDNLHIISTNEGFISVFFGLSENYRNPDATIVGMDEVLYTTGVFPRRSSNVLQNTEQTPSLWLQNSLEMISVTGLNSIELVDVVNSCYRRINLTDHLDMRASSQHLDNNILKESSIKNIIELNQRGTLLIIHISGLIRIVETSVDILSKQLEDTLQIKLKLNAPPERKESIESKEENIQSSKDSNQEFSQLMEDSGASDVSDREFNDGENEGQSQGQGEGQGGSGGNGSGGSGKSGRGGQSTVVLADMNFNIKKKSSPENRSKQVLYQLAPSSSTVSQEMEDRIVSIALQQGENAKIKYPPQDVNSGVDERVYDRLYESVSKEVSQLRVILESVEARERERVWITLQNQGELDDNRLVDGATGERNIYKKRGNIDPLFGAIQKKPKRLRFVVDVSSSMARFNASDRRLDRMAATTVMIMESFIGFEHKYEYSITGQDGDSPCIPFVNFGKPPRTKEQRILAVNQMYHTAINCSSGDHTLAAAHHATLDVLSQPADDYFVFVISDANLQSYGITEKSLGRVLFSNRQVNTYAIFIAGEETAQFLTTNIPAGHGHICMDTSTLPRIFKEVFASVLNDR